MKLWFNLGLQLYVLVLKPLSYPGQVGLPIHDMNLLWIDLNLGLQLYVLVL